jgi:hypothetical protein
MSYAEAVEGVSKVVVNTAAQSTRLLKKEKYRVMFRLAVRQDERSARAVHSSYLGKSVKGIGNFGKHSQWDCE